SNFVLAGTSAGQIFRSGNALSADLASQWTFATPRSGYVSWIAFDPVDPNVVYATYSTFGGDHVWRSADGGATWSGIDGSGAGALPDVPVHCLVVDPQNRNRLFIGSDVGVFVTTDGGATWAVESGIPNVVTEALALNRAQIFAFTYGRGAHRATLGASDCFYSLSPASVRIKAEGGAGSLNISGPNGCPWTAGVNASGESWLRINGANSGGGNGTINFTVEPNMSAVVFDNVGNLYIADYDGRIRRVSTGSGIITTVAGKGDSTFGGDGGPAILAGLHSPNDLAFDSAGNIYIADLGNSRIRKLTR
ncbi:MAG TPA: hypothetical protein VKG02_19550, partial [Blastocatellia bacterium]|nr:hypothetical protein [Blastocatellia bacterium]